MQVTIFPWTSEIQNFCQEHLWNSKISIFSGGKTMNRQICVKDFEDGMLTKLINVNSTSQDGNSEKCM